VTRLHEYPYTPPVCARCANPLGKVSFHIADKEGKLTGQLSCPGCAKPNEKRVA
jgi:hypothetical protein